ncbi:protein phosphatase 2C-like domain-containing protein 1 [Thomomys bottae]
MKPKKSSLLTPFARVSSSQHLSPILPTIITALPEVVGQLEKQEEVPECQENEGSPDNGEVNKAIRVFCKFEDWASSTPATQSSESMSLPKIKKKRSRIKKWQRRKRQKPLKDSKCPKEEQVLPHLIMLPCSVCREETDISDIFLHKKQHEALATLGFQWMQKKKPQAIIIALKRQFVISKLLLSSMFNEKLLQVINNATELLYDKKVPGYIKMSDDAEKSSVYSQKISHLLIKGVATCGDRNSSWQSDMNDKFTIVNDFGNKPNMCFFGLFDGHHGGYSADLASKELPILILHQLAQIDGSYQMSPEQQKFIQSFHTVFREDYISLEERFSSTYRLRRTEKRDYENIHKAFAKAFWRMDRLLRLGRNEVSHVRWSGCSALICLLEGTIRSPPASKSRKRSKGTVENDMLPPAMPTIITGVLHIANVGNVQAVLCRNGKAFCLTKEHTTQNMNERKRVLDSGAVISPNDLYGLLEGKIKTTRGFGFHGNLHLKKFLIPAPQTISVPIDDLCQFLVLATNGLWEVLEKREVISLIITLFQTYKEAYSSPSKDPLLLPSNGITITKSFTNSESNIHLLFQNMQVSTEQESIKTTNENHSGSERNKYHFSNPENVRTLPSEMSDDELFSVGETGRPSSLHSMQTSRNKLHAKDFYYGAAEYVSRELVNAALQAGSRDNITVMVIFLNGSDHPLLP